MTENTSGKTQARQQVRDGLAFFHGTGVDQNDAAAFDCFWRAAQEGDPVGEFMVAVCYDLGRGTPQGPFEALRWYERAAEHGLPEAHFNLGVCYQRGDGVAPDPARAADAYRQAAEQGLAEAVYNYGVCHEFGVGVPQDKQAAAGLYAVAAQTYAPAADRVPRKDVRNGVLGMAVGAGMSLVGAVVSRLSYENAQEGESFHVLTGLILFGVIIFFQGLFAMLKGLGTSAKAAVSRGGSPLDCIAQRLTKPYTVDLFAADGGDTEGDEDPDTEWALVDLTSAKRRLKEDTVCRACPDRPFVLQLSNTPVTDAMLAGLRGNPHLRTVFLLNCKKITETGLRYLAECPNLRGISIGSTTVAGQSGAAALNFAAYKPATDAWLQVIGGMSRLEAVSITGCVNVTDAGVAHLANLGQLKTLSLLGCNRVTDAGLRCLRSMQRLKWLEIGSPQLSGAFLQYLAQLPQLTELMLYLLPAMTDEQLAEVRRIPMLRNLSLIAATNVGKRQVKLLKQWLPNCVVETGPYTGNGAAGRRILYIFGVFFAVLLVLGLIGALSR